MTAEERARDIVHMHCPPGARLNRKALFEAIRWAIVQGDIERRQPRELTPAQAGTMVYQILYFVDEWTRTLHEAEYPEQANRLASCRASILATVLAPPRKPVLREMVNSKAKAKGVGR